MNIQQFNHLINSTNQPIGKEDTKHLESLVTTFPYCQTGHLLVSKALREQGSMLSEMKIKTASAYSINRRHLKRFLIEKTSPLGLIEGLETVEQEDVLTVIESKETNGTVEKIQTIDKVAEPVPLSQEPAEEVLVKDELLVANSTVVEGNKTDEFTNEEKVKQELSIAEEIHRSLEELRKLKEAKPESNSADKELKEIESTVDIGNIGLVIEVEKEVNNYKNEDILTPKIKINEQQAIVSQESKLKATPDSGVVKEKTKKKSPEVIKDKLKALSKKVKEDGEKKVRRQKKARGEINHYLPNEDLFDSKLGESGGAKENSEADLILKYLESIDKKKSKRASRRSQDAILEIFIKNEPQITRTKPVKSPKKAAQEDFSEKSGSLKIRVVNENMAKIHAVQGNTAKAIKIYQALIVKKPEKKSYFATQIEKLKKEQ
jgi:hypothetical protein